MDGMGFTDEDLVVGSSHLGYEIETLRRSYDVVVGIERYKLEQNSPDVEKEDGKNERDIRMHYLQQYQHILLESFLVHTRNLYGFFCTIEKQRYQENDLTAKDYVKDWEKPDFRYLEEVKDQINYRIVHLSKLRNDVPSKLDKWSIISIRREIEEAWMEFLQKVPDEKISEGMNDFKQDELEHISRNINEKLISGNAIITEAVGTQSSGDSRLI